MVWILDCDGVVWLADRPVAGSPEAIEHLRAAGHRVLFLTNHSGHLLEDLLAKFSDMGIAAQQEDIVTSAMAAATLVESGSTALVCAGPGVRQALEARDVHTVTSGPADAVVVGFHQEFDFEALKNAFRAVHGGARLIGTNDDPTYPMPDGPIPGGGALLAAVATAAGVEPEVAGKPYEPMAELVRERLGATTFDGWVVGDRPSTDGLMAQRLKLPFALAFSGVTSEADLPVDPTPDHVGANLAAVVQELA